MIDTDKIGEFAREIFDNIKDEPPEAKEKMLLESISATIWNTINAPMFNQFEFGFLTAYITVYLMLGAGMHGYDAVKDDLHLMTTAYVAKSRGEELPQKARDYIEYYTMFRFGVASDD
jgi:hypothetical protein